MESSKVMNVRRKCFIPGAMFGSFSFININLSGNKELLDDHGIINMVEVAVTFRILQLLYKECASSKQKISIAILSPFGAQVECIQQKLENHYQNDKFFKVNVGCSHNYEGGQVDVVIISTAGVNGDECIDPNTSTQNSNVYFKWARYCLWILGDEKVHLKSGSSIWKSLILDAKARQCFFHATEHKDLAKVIVEVNKDLHQLDELLSGETALFRSTTWKVLFSSNFRISFSKIESWETKKLVLLMLLKISTGWRPKGSSTAASVAKSPYSELLKEFKVRGLHLICTIDIGKETHYTQVLKVWDILPFHKIAELVQRLEGIIGMYTQEYIDCCKARCGAQRGSEFPMKWPGMSTISRYKNQAIRCDEVFMDGASGNSCVENVNVSESLMLMKFYSLSSGEVDNMISGYDGEAIGLPFELTEQEKDVVSFEKSSFILGRSGTGKTTVLTMKLFQNEQLHHLACEGFHEAMDQSNEEVKQDVLHQLFVTFSPKLCFAVRQQVDQWKRLTCGGSLLAQSSSVSIDDIDKMMVSDAIPDHFIHLPHEAYPLVITFHKFLLMLDGTVGTSYFERFPCVWKHSTSRLVFLEQNMRSMDVTYDKFCSKYWPHFNEKFTKNFDPSTVYTEIMSVIKGGLTTGDQACNGILSSDNYVSLCDGRTSILDAQKRRIIYAIFLQYEKKKTEKGDFDLADLVNDLHQRLEVEGYNGDPIDYVCIDEVQDLSMSQIALFKYVCTNVHEGFAFCGDTAQAIAKGIGFRFEDIRCLFFRMFLLGPEKGQISKILQLNENFRTHRGVVNLAQSVIDLLCHFFPLFVDHLSPETSRIRGELPILLETDINNDAVKTIFGRNGDGCQQFIGFGAEQAVLVRDERLKDKVVDIVGKKSIVLTIMESKGLEFQDVLLYDFFSTSSFSNEWRIIYEYMKENGLPNLPSTCVLSPSFNMEKHNVLCSELKQLYVAITRTRQRLWICETTGFSQPIYDYWKKLNLVEVKRLNDSFADKMQIASSKEEWKLRGVKLFHEKNFSMAQMCFLKAADEYSARLTEAYHLRALADGPRVSQLERKKHFKNAAMLFREIGKIELAAECFYEMEDFECMMECVHSFCSEHEMRNFLTKKRCLAELILLEIEWGNFEEAVNVARRKQDLVVEDYLLRMGGLGREYYSSLIILWHVLSNSPIFHGTGEPIAQKNELLTKAVSIAKSDSDVFYQLCEIAKSPPASEFERKKLFKDATKLFREIGKNELAAKCFYKIKDYRTAGDLYWSESMMEKAGNCFCRAKCYELAVEAYDKAGAFAKCLSACADGKLFEIGFQLIGRWGGCGDAELEFYHSAAYYYFDVKDSISMMKCVRSFRSKDDMRLFLNKKNCLDELISLEREWGNFVEAAKVASLKPDPVLQADLLRMGGLYRESSLIILWHVFSNSPIFQSTGEPFKQKDELLMKAVSIAKSDLDIFYQFVCKEAELLSKEAETLSKEETEEFLGKGLELIYWYKTNALAMSSDRVKKTREIETIEKEVLDLLHSLFESGNRLDELLLLEEVRGEFVETAKIGIEDNHSIEAALRRLWYVFFGSLWSHGKRAWPLKDFKQKNKLLDDVKSYLEYQPVSQESELVRSEMSVLSSLEIKLSQMWRYLRETPRERSLRVHFLISRSILDVHLHSCSEAYVCIQICNENHGTMNHLEGILSQDIISVEGLIYGWSHWKGLILDLINWGQVGKDSKIYEDFIFNYFGVRRYDRDTNGFYVVLDAEAQWVKQMNPVMHKNGYLYITPACKFPSVVSRYWCLELVSVAEKVLNKLKTLHTYSTVKNFSMHQQTEILASLFQVAKSLQKCKLPYDWNRANRIVHRSFQLCVDKLLSNVFHLDWKNAQSKEMISLRGSETFLNMLEEAINIKSESWKGLTSGQLGIIAMIFLGSRIEFNDDIKRKVRGCSSMNWRDLFDKLNSNGSSSSKSGDLAISLRNVLQELFFGSWWRVDGCMSAACFLYLMERLVILSFRFNGYVFTTRSSCVEWVANYAHEDWRMGSNIGALETMMNMHHSLVSMVNKMLNSEDDLMEWLTRSKEPSSSYAILVLRLTLLLSLICANSGQHHDHLLNVLQHSHFVSVLPSAFHEPLIKGLKEDHLVDAVAVACEEIDNPLVVMSFTKDVSESLCQNAIFLEMTKTDLSREMMIEVLYP